MLDRPTDPRPARPKEHVVTAFFDRPETANRAYLQLEAAGIDAKKISVLASRAVAERDLAMEAKTKIPEGAAAVSAIGAGVGALAGALTVGGAVAIPGVGWIAGPLVGALFGAGAGSVAGGVVGGLVGAGIPEHEARVVEDAIRRGGVVLAVHATERHLRSIRHVLEKNGGRVDRPSSS